MYSLCVHTQMDRGASLESGRVRKTVTRSVSIFILLWAQSAYSASEWCVVNKMGTVMNCSAFIDPCKQQASFVGGTCILRDAPANQQSQPTAPPAYNPPPPPVQQDHRIGAAGHDPTIELIRLQACEVAAKEAVGVAQDFATLMKYLTWFHGRVVRNEHERLILAVSRPGADDGQF